LLQEQKQILTFYRIKLFNLLVKFKELRLFMIFLSFILTIKHNIAAFFHCKLSFSSQILSTSFTFSLELVYSCSNQIIRLNPHLEYQIYLLMTNI